MLPPVASLVKYDNSVLVSASKDKKGKGTPGKKAGHILDAGRDSIPFDIFNLTWVREDLSRLLTMCLLGFFAGPFAAS